MLAEEADECGGCGRQLGETIDPANIGTYEVVRKRCEACVVLEAEIDNDHEKKRAPRGVKYGIQRVGVADG